MVDRELDFIPNELEYFQEKVYIAELLNQHQNQQWLDEQFKIKSMKKVKKPTKVKFRIEEDETYREFIPYSYNNDLLIINGKGIHLI